MLLLLNNKILRHSNIKSASQLQNKYEFLEGVNQFFIP